MSGRTRPIPEVVRLRSDLVTALSLLTAVSTTGCPQHLDTTGCPACAAHRRVEDQVDEFLAAQRPL